MANENPIYRAASDEAVRTAVDAHFTGKTLEHKPEEYFDINQYSQAMSETNDLGETFNGTLKEITGQYGSYTNYYNETGKHVAGHVFAGKQALYKENLLSEWDKVGTGELSEQDFMMQNFGFNIMRQHGHDVKNPMYWYNKIMNNDNYNPLEDGGYTDSVIAMARNEFNKLGVAQFAEQDLSASTIAQYLNAEGLAQDVDEVAMGEIFGDDIKIIGDNYAKLGKVEGMKKFLSDYRSGFGGMVSDVTGQRQFDGVIYDDNGEATAFYHTDGKLYDITWDGDGQDPQGKAMAKYTHDEYGRKKITGIYINGSDNAFFKFGRSVVGGIAGIIGDVVSIGASAGGLITDLVQGVTGHGWDFSAVSTAYKWVEEKKNDEFTSIFNTGYIDFDSENMNVTDFATLAGGIVGLVASAALTSGASGMLRSAGAAVKVGTTSSKFAGFAMSYTDDVFKAGSAMFGTLSKEFGEEAVEKVTKEMFEDLTERQIKKLVKESGEEFVQKYTDDIAAGLAKQTGKNVDDIATVVGKSIADDIVVDQTAGTVTRNLIGGLLDGTGKSLYSMNELYTGAGKLRKTTDIARMAANDFVINRRRFLMTQLVKDMADTFSYQIAAKDSGLHDLSEGEMFSRALGSSVFNLGISMALSGGLDDSTTKRWKFYKQRAKVAGKTKTAFQVLTGQLPPDANKEFLEIMTKKVGMGGILATSGMDFMDNVLTIGSSAYVKQLNDDFKLKDMVTAGFTPEVMIQSAAMGAMSGMSANKEGFDLTADVTMDAYKASMKTLSSELSKTSFNEDPNSKYQVLNNLFLKVQEAHKEGLKEGSATMAAYKGMEVLYTDTSGEIVAKALDDSLAKRKFEFAQAIKDQTAEYETYYDANIGGVKAKFLKDPMGAFREFGLWRRMFGLSEKDMQSHGAMIETYNLFKRTLDEVNRPMRELLDLLTDDQRNSTNLGDSAVIKRVDSIHRKMDNSEDDTDILTKSGLSNDGGNSEFHMFNPPANNNEGNLRSWEVMRNMLDVLADDKSDSFVKTVFGQDAKIVVVKQDDSSDSNRYILKTGHTSHNISDPITKISQLMVIKDLASAQEHSVPLGDLIIRYVANNLLPAQSLKTDTDEAKHEFFTTMRDAQMSFIASLHDSGILSVRGVESAFKAIELFQRSKGRGYYPTVKEMQAHKDMVEKHGDLIKLLNNLDALRQVEREIVRFAESDEPFITRDLKRRISLYIGGLSQFKEADAAGFKKLFDNEADRKTFEKEIMTLADTLAGAPNPEERIRQLAKVISTNPSFKSFNRQELIAFRDIYGADFAKSIIVEGVEIPLDNNKIAINLGSELVNNKVAKEIVASTSSDEARSVSKDIKGRDIELARTYASYKDKLTKFMETHKLNKVHVFDTSNAKDVELLGQLVDILGYKNYPELLDSGNITISRVDYEISKEMGINMGALRFIQKEADKDTTVTVPSQPMASMYDINHINHYSKGKVRITEDTVLDMEAVVPKVFTLPKLSTDDNGFSPKFSVVNFKAGVNSKAEVQYADAYKSQTFEGTLDKDLLTDYMTGVIIDTLEAYTKGKVVNQIPKDQMTPERHKELSKLFLIEEHAESNSYILKLNDEEFTNLKSDYDKGISFYSVKELIPLVKLDKPTPVKNVASSDHRQTGYFQPDMYNSTTSFHRAIEAAQGNIPQIIPVKYIFENWEADTRTSYTKLPEAKKFVEDIRKGSYTLKELNDKLMSGTRFANDISYIQLKTDVDMLNQLKDLEVSDLEMVMSNREFIRDLHKIIQKDPNVHEKEVIALIDAYKQLNATEFTATEPHQSLGMFGDTGKANTMGIGALTGTVRTRNDWHGIDSEAMAKDILSKVVTKATTGDLETEIVKYNPYADILTILSPYLSGQTAYITPSMAIKLKALDKGFNLDILEGLFKDHDGFQKFYNQVLHRLYPEGNVDFSEGAHASVFARAVTRASAPSQYAVDTSINEQFNRSIREVMFGTNRYVNLNDIDKAKVGRAFKSLFPNRAQSGHAPYAKFPDVTDQVGRNDYMASFKLAYNGLKEMYMTKEDGTVGELKNKTIIKNLMHATRRILEEQLGTQHDKQTRSVFFLDEQGKLVEEVYARHDNLGKGVAKLFLDEDKFNSIPRSGYMVMPVEGRFGHAKDHKMDIVKLDRDVVNEMKDAVYKSIAYTTPTGESLQRKIENLIRYPINKEELISNIVSSLDAQNIPRDTATRILNDVHALMDLSYSTDKNLIQRTIPKLEQIDTTIGVEKFLNDLISTGLDADTVHDINQSVIKALGLKKFRGRKGESSKERTTRVAINTAIDEVNKLTKEYSLGKASIEEFKAGLDDATAKLTSDDKSYVVNKAIASAFFKQKDSAIARFLANKSMITTNIEDKNEMHIFNGKHLNDIAKDAVFLDTETDQDKAIFQLGTFTEAEGKNDHYIKLEDPAKQQRLVDNLKALEEGKGEESLQEFYDKNDGYRDAVAEYLKRAASGKLESLADLIAGYKGKTVVGFNSEYADLQWIANQLGKEITEFETASSVLGFNMHLDLFEQYGDVLKTIMQTKDAKLETLSEAITGRVPRGHSAAVDAMNTRNLITKITGHDYSNVPVKDIHSEVMTRYNELYEAVTGKSIFNDVPAMSSTNRMLKQANSQVKYDYYNPNKMEALQLKTAAYGVINDLVKGHQAKWHAFQNRSSMGFDDRIANNMIKGGERALRNINALAIITGKTNTEVIKQLLTGGIIPPSTEGRERMAHFFDYLTSSELFDGIVVDNYVKKYGYNNDQLTKAKFLEVRDSSEAKPTIAQLDDEPILNLMTHRMLHSIERNKQNIESELSKLTGIKDPKLLESLTNNVMAIYGATDPEQARQSLGRPITNSTLTQKFFNSLKEHAKGIPVTGASFQAMEKMVPNEVKFDENFRPNYIEISPDVHALLYSEYNANEEFMGAFHRAPAVNEGATRIVTIKVNPKLTGKQVMINPLKMKNSEGDFDGDSLQLYNIGKEDQKFYGEVQKYTNVAEDFFIEETTKILSTPEKTVLIYDDPSAEEARLAIRLADNEGVRKAIDNATKKLNSDEIMDRKSVYETEMLNILTAAEKVHPDIEIEDIHRLLVAPLSTTPGDRFAFNLLLKNNKLEENDASLAVRYANMRTGFGAKDPKLAQLRYFGYLAKEPVNLLDIDLENPLSTFVNRRFQLDDATASMLAEKIGEDGVTELVNRVNERTRKFLTSETNNKTFRKLLEQQYSEGGTMLGRQTNEFINTIEELLADVKKGSFVASMGDDPEVQVQYLRSLLNYMRNEFRTLGQGKTEAEDYNILHNQDAIAKIKHLSSKIDDRIYKQANVIFYDTGKVPFNELKSTEDSAIIFSASGDMSVTAKVGGAGIKATQRRLDVSKTRGKKIREYFGLSLLDDTILIPATQYIKFATSTNSGLGNAVIKDKGFIVSEDFPLDILSDAGKYRDKDKIRISDSAQFSNAITSPEGIAMFLSTVTKVKNGKLVFTSERADILREAADKLTTKPDTVELNGAPNLHRVQILTLINTLDKVAPELMTEYLTNAPGEMQSPLTLKKEIMKTTGLHTIDADGYKNKLVSFIGRGLEQQDFTMEHLIGYLESKGQKKAVAILSEQASTSKVRSTDYNPDESATGRKSVKNPLVEGASNIAGQISPSGDATYYSYSPKRLVRLLDNYSPTASYIEGVRAGVIGLPKVHSELSDGFRAVATHEVGRDTGIDNRVGMSGTSFKSAMVEGGINLTHVRTGRESQFIDPTVGKPEIQVQATREPMRNYNEPESVLATLEKVAGYKDFTAASLREAIHPWGFKNAERNNITGVDIDSNGKIRVKAQTIEGREQTKEALKGRSIRSMDKANIKEIDDRYKDLAVSQAQEVSAGIRDGLNKILSIYNESKTELELSEDFVNYYTNPQIKRELDAVRDKATKYITHKRKRARDHFSGGVRVLSTDTKGDIGNIGKDIKMDYLASSGFSDAKLDALTTMSLQQGFVGVESVKQIVETLDSMIGHNDVLRQDFHVYLQTLKEIVYGRDGEGNLKESSIHRLNMTFGSVDNAKEFIENFKQINPDITEAYKHSVHALIELAEGISETSGIPIDSYLFLMAPFQAVSHKDKETQVQSSIATRTKLNTTLEESIAANASYDFVESTTAWLNTLRKTFSAYSFSENLRKEGFLDNSKVKDIVNADAILGGLTPEMVADNRGSIVTSLATLRSVIITSDLILPGRLTNINFREASDGELVAYYKSLHKYIEDVALKEFAALKEDLGMSERMNIHDVAKRYRKLNTQGKKKLNRVLEIYGWQQELMRDVVKMDEGLASTILQNLRSEAVKQFGEHAGLVDKFNRVKKFGHAFPSITGVKASEVSEIMGNSAKTEHDWNVARVMDALNGELYFGNEALGDHLAKNVYYEVSGKVVTKLRELGSKATAGIMSNPLKLGYRAVAFTSFDLGLASIVDPKVIMYTGRALKDLVAFYASKGKYKGANDNVLKYFRMTGTNPHDVGQKDIITKADIINDGKGQYKKFQSKMAQMLDLQSNFMRYALFLSMQDNYKKGKQYKVLGKMAEGIEVYKDESEADVARLGGKAVGVHSVALSKEDQMAYKTVAHIFGNPGDFPIAAKKLRGILAFNTFPLTITRSTRDFTAGLVSAGSKAMRGEGFEDLIGAALKPAMTASMVTAILHGLNLFIGTESGMDEEDLEKLLKEQAHIDPLGSLLTGQPAINYHESVNPLKIVQKMYTEPFTDAWNKDTGEFDIETLALKLVDEAGLGRINPMFKAATEVVTGKDYFKGEVNDVSDKYGYFENSFRKFGSMFLGYHIPKNILNETKMNPYNDNNFIEAVFQGIVKGAAAEVGGSKAYNREKSNYYKIRTEINGLLYSKNSEFDFDSLNDGSINMTRTSGYDKTHAHEVYGLLNVAAMQKAEPSVFNRIILDSLDNGISTQSIQSAIKRMSITNKLEALDDPNAYFDSLDQKGRDRLTDALRYEYNVFPTLNEVEFSY